MPFRNRSEVQYLSLKFGAEYGRTIVQQCTDSIRQSIKIKIKVILNITATNIPPTLTPVVVTVDSTRLEISLPETETFIPYISNAENQSTVEIKEGN